MIKIVDFELGYANGASMAGRDHKVGQSVFVELSTWYAMVRRGRTFIHVGW